ncbi:hypothetical protein AB0Q97_44500, partial [Streptomyces sp. NPDC088135]
MAQGTDTPTSPPGDKAGAGSGTDAYLHRRTLRRGSAGWLLLTGLGVAYVVSGIPLRAASYAVSRAPCSSGRVSSTHSRRS